MKHPSPQERLVQTAVHDEDLACRLGQTVAGQQVGRLGLVGQHDGLPVKVVLLDRGRGRTAILDVGSRPWTLESVRVRARRWPGAEPAIRSPTSRSRSAAAPAFMKANTMRATPHRRSASAAGADATSSLTTTLRATIRTGTEGTWALQGGLDRRGRRSLRDAPRRHAPRRHGPRRRTRQVRAPSHLRGHSQERAPGFR